MVRTWQRPPPPRAHVTEPWRSREQGSGSKDILQSCKEQETSGAVFRKGCVYFSAGYVSSLGYLKKKEQKTAFAAEHPLPSHCKHRDCSPRGGHTGGLTGPLPSGRSGLPTVRRNSKREDNFVFPAASHFVGLGLLISES